MPLRASITGQQEAEPGMFQNLLNSFGNLFARRQKVPERVWQIPNQDQDFGYPSPLQISPDYYSGMTDRGSNLDPNEGPEPQEYQNLHGEQEVLGHMLDIWEPLWKRGQHPRLY